MTNLDELEPRKTPVKPVDLQQMSVSELTDYIAKLESEISRAQATIKQKEAHKSGVDALFGGPKS